MGACGDGLAERAHGQRLWHRQPAPCKSGLHGGDQPTMADFSLCGYMFYPLEESGYDVAARYPHIHAWLQRLRQLPGWASPYDMLPGERILPKW